MQMAAGLDTGPVMLRQAIPILATDTTADLHDKLAAVGATMIVQALDTLPPAIAQSTDGVTYANKIDKAEARIDWTKPAIEIDRQIRGLSPYPGAWCDVAGERLKLLRCEVADSLGKLVQGTPGQVLGGLTIACGVGAVNITLAQREGKRPMKPDDLLRGWALPNHLS